MLFKNVLLVLSLLICFVVPVSAAEREEQRNNQAIKQSTNDNKVEVEDYGVRGHLFNIAEDSIFEEIMAKLKLAEKDGTLEKIQLEFTNRVKEKVLRPNPVANITKAAKSRSWTYNPTYTQDTTIVDDKGRVIVAAGTTVNALDKLKWGEPLILIDSEDDEQVRWVIKQAGKIVLTNGAPLQLATLLKRAVFFDQGGLLCHRFKIESVPAIIEQEAKLLRIREVKI
jgi:conjugal transfer pilus assembly protein TraW